MKWGMVMVLLVRGMAVVLPVRGMAVVLPVRGMVRLLPVLGMVMLLLEWGMVRLLPVLLLGWGTAFSPVPGCPQLLFFPVLRGAMPTGRAEPAPLWGSTAGHVCLKHPQE